jgi:hypothetical protein
MQSYNLIEKVGHGVCTSVTESAQCYDVSTVSLVGYAVVMMGLLLMMGAIFVSRG